jgi:uncharacterized protein Smg (DUF494 family)
MKIKALRTKKEPKEFVEISNIGGINMIFTCILPVLMNITATMDLLKKYYEEHSPLPKEINLDDYELIKYDLIEAGVICADIRNKLSPLNNLVNMLKLYFKEEDKEKKDIIETYIKKEIEQSEISIKYLSELL